MKLIDATIIVNDREVKIRQSSLGNSIIIFDIKYNGRQVEIIEVDYSDAGDDLTNFNLTKDVLETVYGSRDGMPCCSNSDAYDFVRFALQFVDL